MNNFLRKDIKEREIDKTYGNMEMINHNITNHKLSAEVMAEKLISISANKIVRSFMLAVDITEHDDEEAESEEMDTSSSDTDSSDSSENEDEQSNEILMKEDEISDKSSSSSSLDASEVEYEVPTLQDLMAAAEDNSVGSLRRFILIWRLLKHCLTISSSTDGGCSQEISHSDIIKCHLKDTSTTSVHDSGNKENLHITN